MGIVILTATGASGYSVGLRQVVTCNFLDPATPKIPHKSATSVYAQCLEIAQSGKSYPYLTLPTYNHAKLAIVLGFTGKTCAFRSAKSKESRLASD